MKPTMKSQNRETRRARIADAAVIILLMLAVTGCTKFTQVKTSAAGHQISATIVGNHSIDSQPSHGTISSPFGNITIERARVKFDENAWTAIPEGVPVKVSISKGKLWLAADRVTIKRTIR